MWVWNFNTFCLVIKLTFSKCRHIFKSTISVYHFPCVIHFHGSFENLQFHLVNDNFSRKMKKFRLRWNMQNAGFNSNYNRRDYSELVYVSEDAQHFVSNKGTNVLTNNTVCGYISSISENKQKLSFVQNRHWNGGTLLKIMLHSEWKYHTQIPPNTQTSTINISVNLRMYWFIYLVPFLFSPL